MNLPGEYVEERRRYRCRDNVARFRLVQVHPDPRVQAIVEQFRECETLQAAARLRLVYRDKPARIFLLSHLPTDLVVDEFTTWSGVLPDRAEQAAAEAGNCDAELLSAAELVRVYPGKWASEEAAKKWLQRRKKAAGREGTFPYVDSYREMSPPDFRPIHYHLAANALDRKPFSAIVRRAATKQDAEAKLAAVVGPLASVVHFAPEPRDVVNPDLRKTVF